MIQNSYISEKKVAKSMTKLNHASSNKKFRVKSLRMRTQQKHSQRQHPAKTSNEFPSSLKSQQLRSKRQFSPLKPQQSSFLTKQKVNLKDIEQILINSKLRVKSSILLQKDYEKQLQKRFMIPKIIIQQIFRLKLQYDQTKFSQEKYLQFCKNFYLRIANKVEICFQSFNLKGRAIEKFLQFYLGWEQKNIIGLDLSLCSQLTSKIIPKRMKQTESYSNEKKVVTESNEQESVWPMNELLLRLIKNEQRLTKLSIRNLHLTPYQMTQILSQILKASRIYSLDISNKTSQTINRLGTSFSYLQSFFATNQSVGVIKMDNLSIADQCIQKIVHGMIKNNNYPLKILSLANNFISPKSAKSFFNLLTKVGLAELHLSSNPLGPQFYLLLKNLRANTVKYLDLSSTNMNSQSLVHLFNQLVENKCIQTLILDSNDFSHHWFNNIGTIFQSGISLQQLSLVNCGIKNFDQLFQGIQCSRQLTKLNLNQNIVTIQNEDIQKILNCFRINKVLKSVKMRFCGYNEPILIKILDVLRVNKALQVLDISQNHLSDYGAKFILKLLTQNSIISEIGIEKLQLTVKMIQEITNLMEHNNSKRQKKQHINLIDQNRMYKQRDTHSWNDIHHLESQSKKLQILATESKIRNQQLQIQVNQKRQYILEMKKSQKLEIQKMDKDIKKQQQQTQSTIRQINQEIQKITQMQLKSMQALQIEKNLIISLESKILKQNQKIKKRQSQLQEKLRDEKYLQRKKEILEKQSSLRQQSQQLSNKSSTLVFDNTKGLKSLTKKKSISVHKKL